MTEMDLLQHLDAMENRIRTDISDVRSDINEQQTKVQALAVKQEAQDGRLTSVEEKVSWAQYAFGAIFLGGVGEFFAFVKHVLAHK